MKSVSRSQERKLRAELESWQSDLEGLHAKIAHRFRRSEVRQRARRYLEGLLRPIERKNGWQMAEHLGESGPQGVQRLLNAASWDADGVRDDLREYVSEQLGDTGAVLVIDETDFLKKGSKSVGVQRQYSGTAGRIENCQIGVFLAYSSPRGKAFIDRELYLPKSWADAGCSPRIDDNPAFSAENAALQTAEDDPRRKEAGIPSNAGFATKPELARRMLGRAFGANVPSSWVTGDEIYGNDTRLRQYLESEDRAYVLAVSSNHRVWQGAIQVSVDRLIDSLPAEGWQTISAGNGSQGPRLYDWLRVLLSTKTTPDKAHWLLVRRSLSDPKEIGYFLAYGPKQASLTELAQVAGRRWAIEVGFEEAKGLVGLDQYEVRKWDAWYRHVTLALLAHAYLEVTRGLNQQRTDQRGVEKGGLVESSCR